MEEQLLTVAQVAEMRVSTDTVRRLFAGEPGVIDFGRHEPGEGKRRYRLLRIPESVLESVVNRRRVM